MGFLDRAIKKGLSNGIANGISNGINNALEGTIGNKLSEALSPLGEALDKMADQTTNTASEQNATANNSTSYNSGELLINGDVAENFYRILSTEFAGYELRRNVSPTTIGGSSVARDYTFGLYQNGTPRLFITLTPHNRYQNRPFREAKSACESSGIKFLNFFTHFANEKNYVINRINDALG